MQTLPHPFTQRIRQQLGNDADLLLEALEAGGAPTSVRQHPIKCPLPTAPDPVPWCPQARYLSERPSFTLDPAFHAGAYYVQEASSMFLAEALRQITSKKKPLKCLDLCAAPGGKSTLLASQLPKGSFLVANEVIRSRYHILRENLSKWGYANTATTQADPKAFGAMGAWFDLLLVDAPCSGEGLFRKDMAAAGHWSEDNAALCSARQKRILADSLPCLKAGGMLIYSTCTYNPAENDDNVEWLIQEHGFISKKLDISHFKGIKETTYGLQFFPHLIKGEGFYIAVLEKQAGKEENLAKMNKKKKNNSKKTTHSINKEQAGILSDWLSDAGIWQYRENAKGEVWATPKSIVGDVDSLLRHFPSAAAGIRVGSFKKNQFIPAHELAISLAVSPELPAVGVDRDTALRFLRKENIHPENGRQGWLLIRHDGLNLGWIKSMKNRSNNYYPKEWRIRMGG